MPSRTDLLSCALTIDGFASPLVPTDVRVKDAIGTPRRIEVAVYDSRGAKGDELLGKGAQVDVLSAEDEIRRFEGVVLKVKESWRATGVALLVTIGSPLDYLALSSDCRIFQAMTVPEIVTQVLTDAGFPADRIVKRLSGTYAKLASCTQYGETMLAFITRLLEAEGAYYFFEDSDQGLSIVLGDSSSAHNPSAGEATLPFVEHSETVEGFRVTTMTEIEKVRPEKVTLRDFDFEKPDLDLDSSEKVTAAGAREVYDHPGGYLTTADGSKRAQARLHAFISDASQVEGRGLAPALSAGGRFTLENGPRQALSIEWLVTSVEHVYKAKEPVADRRFVTTFRAIPKAATYRPLAKTPRPRIRGPQTAVVTGPAGQEIHTDQYGHVKLKFHWDRHSAFDDKSSAWVRVSQLAMNGSMMVPRIGWEVVVEFEHGDPDRPVVIGRVYNGMYLPPYPLPDKKTMSVLGSYTSTGGAGHNEIRIEDASDSEHIHWHVQKDMEVKVANDRNAHVTQSRMVQIKADETITVKGNRTFEVDGLWDVTVAGNQSLTVQGARSKTVKKDEHITVEGDRTLTVTGAHDVSSSANLTISAEGDVSTTVTGTLTESADEGTSIVVGDDMSRTIGGPLMESPKKGKTSTVEGKQSVTVGAAMIDVSGKDLSVTVGGKRTSTVGAAWNVTSAADIQISSGDALEMTIAGALTMAGAQGVVLKVGDSKVLIGQGGVTVQSGKVKVSSDGPAALTAGVIGSK
jgi:type VI secretion system secreted protein VgrG